MSGMFLLLWAGQSFANSIPSGVKVSFEFPGEGVEIAEKKPQIRCATSVPVSEERLLVLLDGVDITGVLDLASEGFTFTPIQTLASGEHQLHVIVTIDDGSGKEYLFSFSTIHQGYFDQASSDNQISTVFEQVLKRSADADYIPYQNLAVNLGSDSLVTRNNWTTGLRTNLRFLDRSAPVYAPEEKGIDLVDYVISSRYAGEKLGVLTEIGDLQLQETRNTIMGLARRGVRAVVDYKSLSVSSFRVQSEQVYGFDGGTGLNFDGRDNIRGVSVGLKLLSDTLTLRTIYLTGSEEGSSFGMYSDAGARQGDVLGFLLVDQLFAGKLNLEAEYDTSDFDADDSDEFASETSRAWNIKAGGVDGKYNYQALYEYAGRDYEVVGNQGLQRDRQGFTLTGGMQVTEHTVTLSGSRYVDNVEEDVLFPQTEQTAAMVDYSFTKFPTLPMGLGFQHSIIESSMVPEFGSPIEINTDMISTRLSHQRGAWSYNLNTSYSIQDDRTPADYDTRAQTYSFAPMYYSEHLSFSPNLSFIRSTDDTRDVDTDTRTMSLDLRGDLYAKKCLYELAGNFSQMEMSDKAMKMEILSTTFRIAYVPGEKIFGLLNPSIGLRGLYNKTDDQVYEQTTEEFALLLAISTSIGISF